MALYGDYSGKGTPSASAIKKMMEADAAASKSKAPAPVTTVAKKTSSSSSSSSGSGDFIIDPKTGAKYVGGMFDGRMYTAAEVAKQYGVVITPESLAPAALTPFAQPATSPVPNVQNLYETPPLAMTPSETQAQGITDRLQALNQALVGKTAYRVQQERQFGVDKTAGTINDLGSQLTGLKNEAAAIPMQLQQGAAERGVTIPQLGRQENSRLRTNAIAALGVSSLLAAAQGQMATAINMVDRAVDAKFEPVQEEINALSSNLNLILASPTYNIEQKNRAQKQLDNQAERQAKLDEQKENDTAIKQIALNAAASGADGATLKKIQEAKTSVEATTFAARFLKTQDNIEAAYSLGITTPLVNKNGEWFSPTKNKTYSDPEELFKDFPQLGGDFNNAYRMGLVTDLSANKVEDREFAKQARVKYLDAGINLTDDFETVRNKIFNSPTYQAEGMGDGFKLSPGETYYDPYGNIIAQAPADNTKMTDDERALMTQFTGNPIVKDFNTIQTSKIKVDNIIKNGVGGPADLALVFNFMKSLDPTSVVREQEYANAAKSGNIFSGVFAKYNGYLKENGGFLPESVKKEFQNLTNQAYQAQESQYNNWREQIRGIAERQGLNPDNVTPDFSGFIGQRPNIVELMHKDPAITDAMNAMLGKGISWDVAAETIYEQMGFNQAGKPQASAGKTPYLKTLGSITGYGSPAWKYGLDIDLKKGDPVKSPVSGKVIASGYEKGFGNTVKIQDSTGKIWRLSHFDKLSLKSGQTVNRGQLVGLGGNTGTVIPMGGGDGSHLDLTIYIGGKPISAKQVKTLLDKTFV